ncbi:hypothetical protein [Pseudoalteromonas umbrosa]|uniref:hypothetical protein n=1 Tax=Pseudoalteromonas umbrosa TaxID=3048489 RepID=UPI0024C2AD2F|nr:hypothetical protein [Pseudoalteromonas sp. B95]MDK1285770.1 hypothetical protein [Pseudoalteromonas sp. B95]
MRETLRALVLCNLALSPLCFAVSKVESNQWAWQTDFFQTCDTNTINGYFTVQATRGGNYSAWVSCKKGTSKNWVATKARWSPEFILNELSRHDIHLTGFYHASSGIDEIVYAKNTIKRSSSQKWEYQHQKNHFTDIERFLNSKQCQPKDISGIRSGISQFGSNKEIEWSIQVNLTMSERGTSASPNGSYTTKESTQGVDYDVHTFCRQDRSDTRWSVNVVRSKEGDTLIQHGKAAMIGAYNGSKHYYLVAIPKSKV